MPGGITIEMAILAAAALYGLPLLIAYRWVHRPSLVVAAAGASAPAIGVSTPALRASIPPKKKPTPKLNSSTPARPAPAPAAEKPTPEREPPTTRGPLVVEQKVLPRKVHAARLLAWMHGDASGATDLVKVGRARDVVAGEILFDDVKHIYAEMCLALGWQQWHWTGVGRHFNELLGGKPYVSQRIFVDGTRKRPRVYHIPAKKVKAALPAAAEPTPDQPQQKAA